MKAIWNGVVVAESNQTKEIEGNQYFPPEAIKKQFFKESSHHSQCPWKGNASYYHLDVAGKNNENAAWFYPDPKEAAQEIKDHVAFWKGVKIEK